MELDNVVRYDKHIPGMKIDLKQSVRRELNCDSRYRSIIGQLDVLIEIIRREPGCNLASAMDRLLSEMMDHIGSENDFMEQVDYPQTTVHRIHHHYIYESTDAISQRFRMGQDVPVDKLDYVRLLWIVHIQMHDRAFEEYLAS